MESNKGQLPRFGPIITDSNDFPNNIIPVGFQNERRLTNLKT